MHIRRAFFVLVALVFAIAFCPKSRADAQAILSLPTATPLPSDVLPFVHNGTTYQGTVAQFLTAQNGAVGAYVADATLAAPTNYVFGFGDSIIGVGGYATGTTCPSNSHMGTPETATGTCSLEKVASYFSKQVINEGIAGSCAADYGTSGNSYCHSSSSGINRYTTGLTPFCASTNTVIIEYAGTNDPNDTAFTVASYKSQLNTMVAACRAADPSGVIIMWDMIPIGPTYTAQVTYGPAIRAADLAIAQANNVYLAPTYEALVPCWTAIVPTPTAACTADNVHPNLAGQLIAAAAMLNPINVTTQNFQAAVADLPLVNAIITNPVFPNIVLAPSFGVTDPANGVAGQFITSASQIPDTIRFDTGGLDLALSPSASGSLFLGNDSSSLAAIKFGPSAGYWAVETSSQFALSTQLLMGNGATFSSPSTNFALSIGGGSAGSGGPPVASNPSIRSDNTDVEINAKNGGQIGLGYDNTSLSAITFGPTLTTTTGSYGTLTSTSATFPNQVGISGTVTTRIGSSGGFSTGTKGTGSAYAFAFGNNSGNTGDAGVTYINSGTQTVAGIAASCFGLTQLATLNLAAGDCSGNWGFAGNARAVGYIAAGSTYVNGSIVTGDLSAARSATSGVLFLGAATVDYGVLATSKLTLAANAQSTGTFESSATLGGTLGYVAPNYTHTGVATGSTMHCIVDSVTASSTSTTIALTTTFASNIYPLSIFNENTGTLISGVSAKSASGWTFPTVSGDIYSYSACGA